MRTSALVNSFIPLESILKKGGGSLYHPFRTYTYQLTSEFSIKVVHGYFPGFWGDTVVQSAFWFCLSRSRGVRFDSSENSPQRFRGLCSSQEAAQHIFSLDSLPDSLCRQDVPILDFTEIHHLAPHIIAQFLG